eukprot:gene12563-biopygen10011
MATIGNLLSRGQGAGVAVIPGVEAVSQPGDATVSQGGPVNPATAPSFLSVVVSPKVAYHGSPLFSVLCFSLQLSIFFDIGPLFDVIYPHSPSNWPGLFTLLRPGNLKKLPASEPTSTQLAKLLRTELEPVRDILDWAEAWAAYMGIAVNKAPEKIAGLISCFLLLASAFRDIPGGGWLEYDIFFRKHVAENPSKDWGEILPTLWMTTTFVAAAPDVDLTSQPVPTEVLGHLLFPPGFLVAVLAK